MQRWCPSRGLGFALAAVLAPALAGAQPVGTAFTYQGRLADGTGPANGGYDLQFVVYDAATGGSPVGPVVTRDDILVAGGLFAVSLDFGAVFGTDKRWLEIGVRPGSSTGTYTLLTPRQEITPTPGALSAASARSAPWTGLLGVPAGFADNVDNDSGGDITGVTAGSGLIRGGNTGTVTLEVSFAGPGIATTVPRSDHHHFGQVWSGAGANAFGFYVRNTDPAGGGLSGIATGGGWGVLGTSEGPTGGKGVYGRSQGVGGVGVEGLALGSSGSNYGVYGETYSPQGVGVFGRNWATTGAHAGVVGTTASVDGQGVVGTALADSGNTVGVSGSASSPTGRGVFGFAEVGVHGLTSSLTGGAGVEGISQQGAGVSYGVYGRANSPAAFAGYFAGRAHVTGTLSKGAGSFKIDHPLDPENKYLYHSFVESPDMMNLYNGNVTTDAEGAAVVHLPEWFEPLNRDFRYQLTAIGQFVQAMVSEEIAGNRFAIRTDKPHVRISWQVTGIRRDAFAEKHRIPVEEDKPEVERGTYLHPEDWNVPRERSLEHKRRPHGR
jgi:hypothetical protein